MTRILSGMDLAIEGWSGVTIEHGAYRESYFENLDLESIQSFIDKAMYDFELIELSDGSEYDYALVERVNLQEYDVLHNND